MRKARTRVTAAMLVAGALILSACGGGDDGATGDDAGATSADVTGAPDATATADESSEPAGSGASTATDSGEAPASDDGEFRVLTLAPVGEPASFAPQLAGDGHAVQWSQPAYDTLVYQAPDGTFHGMLAASWEYDDTNTVLTLNLVTGVTFSDGEPFDADAVKTNLEATRDGGGNLSTQLSSIADVVVVDDATVELHLSAPDPSLIRGLSQPSGAIASPGLVGTPELEAHPVGTGPYVLDDERTTPSVEYVFVKRADYWNTALDLPYDELIMRPLPDITARVNALQSGQIDGTYIDTKTMAQVEGSGAKVITYPAAGVVGMFILDRAGEMVPALGDVRVRQAMNLAVDRATMLQALRDGRGTVTEQVFNPESNAWLPELNETYAYDLEQAAALIDEAGYGDGFTIQMPDIAFFPEQPIVVQALTDLGITVELVPVAQTEVLGAMMGGQFPVIIMQLQSTDPWQAINFFVAPDATWNALHTSDPELDALIADAQAASGDAQTEAYHEINRWLVDNAWFAPFYFPDNVYATSADVDVVPQFQQGVPSIYNYSPAG